MPAGRLAASDGNYQRPRRIPQLFGCLAGFRFRSSLPGSVEKVPLTKCAATSGKAEQVSILGEEQRPGKVMPGITQEWAFEDT